MLFLSSEDVNVSVVEARVAIYTMDGTRDAGAVILDNARDVPDEADEEIAEADEDRDRRIEKLRVQLQGSYLNDVMYDVP